VCLGLFLANGAGVNSKVRISSDDIKFADFVPRKRKSISLL